MLVLGLLKVMVGLWTIDRTRRMLGREMAEELQAKSAGAVGLEVKLMCAGAGDPEVGVNCGAVCGGFGGIDGLGGLDERLKADIVRVALREASVRQLLTELEARGIRPNVEITVNYSNHTFNRCNVRMLVSDGQLVGEVDDVPMDGHRIGRR